MAIDITDLSLIYDTFLTKSTDKLANLQTATQMEDEHFAGAVSTVIAAAMENSIRSLQVIKTNQLLDAQIATELNKAIDVASTTAVRNSNSNADIINKTKQGVLLDKQALKLIVDTLFVEKQTLELGRSVEFNNNIKALDSYADMIGTMGAGGLVISSDMWSTLFAMIQVLNANGSIPTSTTITKL